MSWGERAIIQSGIHVSYTILVRVACVKTNYQALRTYGLTIHTEKFAAEVTKIRLASLAPITYTYTEKAN